MEKELNYIYSYIKYIYFNVDELKDERYLLDLSRRIKNSMPNSSFSEGNLNFYISNFVNQDMKYRNSNSYAKYQSLKSYIYLSIDYYRIFYGKRIENQDVVIREVMKSITSTHRYEDILEGKCESEIETLIEIQPDVKFKPTDTIEKVPLDISHIKSNGNSVVDDRTYMSNYILNYLKSMYDLFEFQGDLKVLSDLICRDMCKMHISADEVLTGEYDTQIDSYIRKRAFGIKFTNKFRDVYIEVSRFVMNNHTYMDIGNMEKCIAEEIFKLSRYLIKSGYDKDSIKNGQCDTIMENHMRSDCLRVNSEICKDIKLEGKDKNPNKFFLNSKQLFESIKKPIIVAVALGIIGTSIVFINSSEKISSNNDVGVFDTYDYPSISHTTSEEFAETLEHIIEYYDIYEEYNEGYGQICLYRAYESIKGNEREKTYAMDIMFNLIKSRAKYNEDMQILYNDILPYQSYMEYVYDRINDKTSRLNDDIYAESVRTYASQVANYKELNPFSLLSKEKQNALKNMMSIYGKYIDGLEDKFDKAVNVSERKK